MALRRFATNCLGTPPQKKNKESILPYKSSIGILIIVMISFFFFFFLNFCCFFFCGGS